MLHLIEERGALWPDEAIRIITWEAVPRTRRILWRAEADVACVVQYGHAPTDQLYSRRMGAQSSDNGLSKKAPGAALTATQPPRTLILPCRQAPDGLTRH